MAKKNIFQIWIFYVLMKIVKIIPLNLFVMIVWTTKQCLVMVKFKKFIIVLLLTVPYKKSQSFNLNQI